jgi:hypothetical protein
MEKRISCPSSNSPDLRAFLEKKDIVGVIIILSLIWPRRGGGGKSHLAAALYVL